MHPARHLSAVTLFLVLAACSARSLPLQRITSTPSQTIASTTINHSPLPSPATTSSGVAKTPLFELGQPTATRLAPSVTPSIQNTPLPSSPVETELANISFSPWELVLALVWSPDGGTFAVAAGESIHLYEANSLQERLKLESGVWSTSLAFSPDGVLLASGSRDGRARLWDTSSGVLKLSLSAHKKGVNSVAFSPDGRWLASGGNDAVARLWDVSSGKQLGQLIGGTFAVPAIAFSRNGNGLAIVNGSVIRLRDVETSRFIQTFRGDNPFYSLAVSPDGLTLAAGTAAGTVSLWDIGSGALRHTLSDPGLSPASSPILIWSVAYSPDGKTIAAGGSDGRIRLWDASSGELLASWVGHARPATSVAFSPDGLRLASGSLDGSVRFWQVK
jgi:WD40 repeat protein